jgi:hypothetical protein
MNRLSLIAAAVAMLFGLRVIAQDLPSPPKPPKSKAGAGEAVPEKGAAQKKSADEKSPSDQGPPATEKGDRGHRLFDGDVPRPRRLIINAPFFHMDLNFGGHGPAREVMPYRESAPATPAPAGEAVPAPRADEIPAPRKADDQTWRYRWHDGRWWYWMPSEHWVYWEEGRWNEAGRPTARRLGALRDRMGGLNLQDLMQSDQIRIGEPRRGNVELELEGLPSVNFGF